jgi:biopolymer transport protein ExbD
LDKIPAAMKDRFKTRANWTVYVTGDEDALYQDVMAAVDVIRFAHGSAILLTSKSGANI